MIRLWTGCVTDDEFYDYCDEQGIMVWDDFWLYVAYNDVADHNAFIINARDKVRRLRNHACIAVWCGANETHPVPDIDQALRMIVTKEDGNDRLYKSCSNQDGLSGSGWWRDFPPAHHFETSASNLAFEKPAYPYGYNYGYGFRTEIGMATFPQYESVCLFIPKDKQWPLPSEQQLKEDNNNLWNYHFFGKEASNAFPISYVEAVDKRYGKPKNLQAFCERAQLVNLEDMKGMYEAWQDKMWNDASGMLIWMSHPAYPSFVWQTYDYYYDFTSETASETDIIPGLTVEFNKKGKTPKFYEGFGFMYPVYYLDAEGADNKSAGAIESGNISIAEGKPEQYAAYTYINNYSKSGIKTAIQAADQPFPLNRFSDMLTKVEVYSPVEEVVITSETATINFKEMADEPVSSSSSNAGDITEERTFNVGSSTLLVTPSNATTPNRFWSTSTGPQLRVYGGYLVVTAPEGKAVTNVSINQGKWNSSNTFNGEASATSEWTGNSTNLMIGIAANTQINSITVTTDAATDATTTYVPTVTSINAVKALPLETEVKFELNSVKTTLWSARAMTMYSYIEDATGAMAADMNISNFLYDLIPFGTDIDEGADVRMEGTLWATRSKDSNGIPTLTLSEKTGTDSQVSFTQIEIEPSEAAVATVLKDSANNFRNYLCKYISFSNVTLSKQVVDEYTTNYYIVSGEDSILMYDQYWQLPTIIPDYESIEKIPGFVGIGWDGTFEFHPYGKIEGTLKPAVQVESIGALKQLDNMSNVTLTLNNAQIKVYAAGWWSSEVFIEDETGGIKVDQTIIDLFPDYFDKAGRTFTGELNCYYMNEYGSRYISVNELTTAQSELTVGEAEVVPTTVTLAEAITAPYEGRLVTIEAPEVTTDEEGYTLFITQGETTVQIMDKFNAIPVDDNWNYVLYDKVKSATGLVIESAGEILFLPYGENAFVEDTATGINELQNSNHADQPLFNLRGMKVQNTKGLKGLYIQNGKKVMFK